MLLASYVIYNTYLYDQRLKELGLPTLIYRRERADMIQLFKILNSYDEVHLSSLHLSHNTSTRGHCNKLHKKVHNLKVSQNSFVARSTNNWNNLPNSCVLCNSVNSFNLNPISTWLGSVNPTNSFFSSAMHVFS